MLTFYDSGIGGLTIVKEYLKLYPSAKIQYFADFDILPMGDKSQEQIINQIKTVAIDLFRNSNLLVLACNTASVNTIRELQQNWLPKHFPNKQILSISKPITELLESKYLEFKNQKLVILATQATIDSGFYQQEFKKIGFESVLAIACPGLCGLIEALIGIEANSSRLIDPKQINQIIRRIENIKLEDSSLKRYLTNLKIPTGSLILLACTHYPIIKNQIAKVNPNCTIIDPSQFIAQKLVQYQYCHPLY